MYDTSGLTDELKVCSYPKATKKILDDMGDYMNFLKIEMSVNVGRVVGYNGTNWVLADIDDPSTWNYLHIVLEQDGQYVYISPYAKVNSSGNGFAYLGNTGNVVFEETAVKVGFANGEKLFFMGK